MQEGNGRYIPETVDGPGVSWARGWVSIPELSLQEGTTGVVEAASSFRGRALATEGAVVGANLELGRGANG
jgi:hypothetical protein